MSFFKKYITYSGFFAFEEAANYYADLILEGSKIGGIKGNLIQAIGWTGGLLTTPFATNPEEIIRRESLKYFAQRQFLRNSNHCDILTQILNYSSDSVSFSGNPKTTMLLDLQVVLVGDGLRFGRGTGRYFAGNIRGSQGFKPQFRDDFNQIQHAVAGLLISHKFGWLGYKYAKLREEELQDDLLYDSTRILEKSISDDNYYSLASSFHKAICE